MLLREALENVADSASWAARARTVTTRWVGAAPLLHRRLARDAPLRERLLARHRRRPARRPSRSAPRGAGRTSAGDPGRARAGSHQVTAYGSSPSKAWMPGRTLVNGIVSVAVDRRVGAEALGPRLADGLAAPILGGIERRVQRTHPAAVYGRSPTAQHDQQIAGARRGDVSDADAFGLVARHLDRLVLPQLRRRPAGQADRAARALGVHPARRACCATARRRCRPARRPGTRAPWPCAPSSAGRRRCPPRGSAPRPRASPRPRRAAARRSRGTTGRRPPRYWRASSPTYWTLASACSPDGRSAKIACARDASSSAAIVSATGPLVAPQVQLAQQPERRGHLEQRRGMPDASDGSQIGHHGHRHREFLPELLPEAPAAETGGRIWRGPVGEQHVVAEREQRAAQRAEDRQLVVRPLDRGERGAQRLDLLALVEALAADEQVRQAARLERLHVGPRHVDRRPVEASACRSGGTAGRRRAPGSARARSGRSRSVTVQPLACTSQSTNAATASRLPFGDRRLRRRRRSTASRCGTGSATIAGCATLAGRTGASGT